MLDGSIVQSSETSVQADGIIPQEFFQSFEQGDFATPQNGNDSSVPQIDEELQQAQGDPNKMARIWQSRYDKQVAEFNKTKQVYEEIQRKAQVFEQLTSNPEVLRSFVSKIAPDLVQSVDPEIMIETELRKQFGDDFVPDENDLKKPWTKSARYYKTAEELWNKYENQSKSVGNFDDLLQEQAQRQQAQQQELEQVRRDIKTKFNASDEQINEFFTGFAPKLTPIDLFRIFQTTQKFKTPNIANNQGNFNSGMSGSREAFLKSL